MVAIFFPSIIRGEAPKPSGVLIWFEKGFNMVKKGFIAFGWHQKPTKKSCGVVPSEKKKTNPAGWNLPKNKLAFLFNRRKQYCNQTESNKNGFNEYGLKSV